MDQTKHMLRLFEYDSWANLKLLAILEDHDQYEQREKSERLFLHLLNSQELWYRRSTGMDYSDLELWPDQNLENGRDKIQKQFDQWTALIREKQPDAVVSYQNSKGTPYETRFSDIVQHLVIHGQHHRAQISMLLRMSGIAPPATDFIFYTRD